jgi:SAM-dependent methyltransferase
MWWLDDVLRAQFGKPSGLFGALVVGPALNLSSIPLVNVALDSLQLHRGDHLLDVGFGAGYSLLAASKRLPVGRIIGIDYSGEMIEAASRLLQGSPNTVMCQADVMRLPFKSGSFDKALSANSIYYWPDPVTGLREIHRTLHTRGRLAVAVRSPARLRPLTWSWNRFRIFEPQELSSMMSDAGFRVLRVDHCDRWLPLDTVIVLAERS